MTDNEWKIAKPAAACCLCAQQFSPGLTYYSALLQGVETLQRHDYCAACFQSRRPQNVYYFWKRTSLDPEIDSARRQPAVDIEYVLEFFRRLDGDASPQKLAFRYILALMLTRKRVLVSEGRKSTPSAAAQAVHIFRERHGGTAHEVLEPDLSESEIETVSAELGVLLGLSVPPAKATVPAESAALPAGAPPGGAA